MISMKKINDNKNNLLNRVAVFKAVGDTQNIDFYLLWGFHVKTKISEIVFDINWQHRPPA